MLDRKFILENVGLVESNCRDRGVAVDVQKLATLEQQRRKFQTEAEEANRQANAASKAIGKAANDQERELRKAEGRQLREQKDALHTEVETLEKQIREIHSRIPNLSHPSAPVGADDAANRELKRGKTPLPSFDFTPRDHVQLGDILELFDFDAGGKVAGHGFYYLKNEAVLLELALQQFVIRMLVEENFTPIITPDLAKTEILQGVGFIPRGPETQIYSIADSDLNFNRYGRNYAWWNVCRYYLTARSTTDTHVWHKSLLPHRGWGSGTRLTGPLSRSSVYESRDVCLHTSR